VIKSKFFMGLIIIILSSCVPFTVVDTSVNIQPTSTPINSIAVSTSTSIPVKETLTVISPTPSNKLQDMPFITISVGDGNNVIVRTGPGITYPKAGLLASGDKAVARGRTAANDWIYIDFPGAPQGKAWVYSVYTKLDGGELPIIDPDTGKVVMPTSATPLQAGDLNVIEAIKHYLKQDDLQCQYLGDTLFTPNNPDQKVGRCQVGNTIYSVDLKTNYIVAIDTQGPSQAGNGNQLSPAELEKKAKNLIAELAPNVNLQLLTPQPGNKENDFFFRWENKNHDFIQVGYSSSGQLLNYINTINSP